METLIINGLVGYVDHKFDECNTNSTIGVIHEHKIKTFKGEVVVDQDEESLFELLESFSLYNKFVTVTFVTSDKEIDDPAQIVEEYVKRSMGFVEEYNYHHHFSSYTGYLWTDEEFNIGGHDIKELFKSLCGQYIHMEIEIYEKYEVPKEYQNIK